MKKLIKFSVILLYILLGTEVAHAQDDYVHGTLWVTIKDDNVKPAEDGLTNNSKLNEIFGKYGVTSFKQALPYAKNPDLLKIYEINFTGDDDEFIFTLLTDASSLVEKPYRNRPVILDYNPNDYFWTAHANDWMWHLKKIKADSAWDVSRGDASVKIAVLDTYFDTTHPDLRTKFTPNYDPLTGYPFYRVNSLFSNNSHGTVVAGFAGAQTTDSTAEPPDTAMYCSLGYKTQLMGYPVSYSTQLLEKALHASNIMHANIITMSVFITCYPDTTGYEEKVAKEILDNGTTILKSAGNGFCSGCYNNSKQSHNCNSIPADFQFFSSSYPFSPTYDERIIIVSGTSKGDSLTHFYNGNNQTWSYFPEVDVCAPGHEMMGISPTLVYDTTYDTIYPNPWPFYGNSGGTSFSTPIVAGLCGLIASINPNLSPGIIQKIIKSTTDPVADAGLYADSTGQSQTGTGRINAYKALLYTRNYYSPQYYIIHTGENITWSDTKYASGIYIESGGILTIDSSSTVYFSKNAQTIIERGGKLSVNGGHLTSRIGTMWQGIEVWGNVDSSQYTNGAQGTVEIKNKAIIENAIAAIKTIRSTPSDNTPEYDYAGGIVYANYATFRNNQKAIDFYPYENFNPINKKIVNNLSHIQNCNFETTDTLFYNGYKPDAFIAFSGIRGIQVKGCSFVNSCKKYSEEEKGKGIYSINSSYSVNELCLDNSSPCTNERKSTFKGLCYGIKALGINTDKTFTADQCDFNNNITSIYLSSVNNAAITRNSFIVNASLSDSTAIYGGIYLDYCTGYTIEENYFESDYEAGGGFSSNPQIGIVVNSSGTQNNFIYNNYFEKFYIATLAQDQNRSADGSTGLTIKCNDYSGCNYDIAVTQTNPNATGMGIMTNQGYNGTLVTHPAGNTFSLNPTPSDGNYHNEGENITYWYHANAHGCNIIPTKHTALPKVNPQPTAANLIYNKSTACPSSFTSGNENADGLKATIAEAEQNADSTQQLLTLLVDGGDTPALTTEVQTSTPSEAETLRNELLTQSPYLSDTVIISSVKKEEVLSGEMVTEVLTANPHAVKSDKVMQQVDSRASPLTNEQKAEIEQNWFIIGARENLEAAHSASRAQKSYAFYKLCRLYRNNSLNPAATDSLLSLLAAQNELDAKYELAFEYLEHNDTLAAQNAFNAIPMQFTLAGADAEEYQYMTAIFGMQKQWKARGKCFMQADSLQKSLLYPLASGSSLASAYARNLLIATDSLLYHEPYVIPTEGYKNARVIIRKENEPSDDYNLTIYPNPAKNYLIANYSIKEGDADAQIKIYDAGGKHVKSVKVNSRQNFAVVAIDNLPSGQYICSLIAKNKQMKSIKFIIHR